MSMSKMNHDEVMESIKGLGRGEPPKPQEESHVARLRETLERLRGEERGNGVVDYDAPGGDSMSRMGYVPEAVAGDLRKELETLRAENNLLRADRAELQRRVESLQAQIALRVRQEAEFIPYHDYEDR
jgi:uncharacterized protein YceH (UPF0502 family)